MDQYVGLDVSLKETSISGSGPTTTGFGAGRVLVASKDGRPSNPKTRTDAALVVFETGPLATWFHRELTADGLPKVSIDARHAKAALDTAPNKTDANDADGLSLLGLGRFLPGGSRQKPCGDAGGAIAISDCGGAGPDQRARSSSASQPSSRTICAAA